MYLDENEYIECLTEGSMCLYKLMEHYGAVNELSNTTYLSAAWKRKDQANTLRDESSRIKDRYPHSSMQSRLSGEYDKLAGNMDEKSQKLKHRALRDEMRARWATSPYTAHASFDKGYGSLRV